MQQYQPTPENLQQSSATQNPNNFPPQGYSQPINNSQFQNPSYYYQNSNFSTPTNQPLKTPTKAIKPKVSIINPKNILVVVLCIYSIFSFAWIAILYTGIEGTRICLNDNVICKISVPFSKQAAASVNNNIETKNQLVKQKSAKNFIKDIWQNQAILNDSLVTRQQSVEKSIGEFTAYIQNYIRFINDKPEFLKGFSKVELENKKTDLEQQLANLKLLQDNNYQNKINYQKQINELYQELGERQDNSFITER